MKNLMRGTLIGLAGIVLGARQALAACYINGEEVPCEDIPKWLVLIPIVMLVVAVLFFIFWIKMLIHAINSQSENKIVWILVIIFLQVLGAIIYYFVEKRPSDRR